MPVTSPGLLEDQEYIGSWFSVELDNGITGNFSQVSGLAIEIEVNDAVAFPGHREDLEEILGNLMENACKWAASRVRVSAEEDRDHLKLIVDDDGPGMPAEQAAEASRRGKRFDQIASGWGLGLSIVSDLVEVSGGSVAFSKSPLGGLRACVDLPRP